jgi:hypothetical protein
MMRTSIPLFTICCENAFISSRTNRISSVMLCELSIANTMSAGCRRLAAVCEIAAQSSPTATGVMEDGSEPAPACPPALPGPRPPAPEDPDDAALPNEPPAPRLAGPESSALHAAMHTANAARPHHRSP